MPTRFAIVLVTLMALIGITLIVTTPIVTSGQTRPQPPGAVAGCYAVDVGAWSSPSLLDTLGFVTPGTVELSLDRNPQQAPGIREYRMRPARLAGVADAPAYTGNWGVHYHGGIIAGWDYGSFGLHLYLSPSRGALRGSASLMVRDTGWRFEHAPATLSRVACAVRP